MWAGDTSPYNGKHYQLAEPMNHPQPLASLGIQHFIFSMPNVHEITPIEVIGREVIPAVADF